MSCSIPPLLLNVRDITLALELCIDQFLIKGSFGIVLLLITVLADLWIVNRGNCVQNNDKLLSVNQMWIHSD